TDNGHIDYAAAQTIFPARADRTDQIAYDTLKVPRGRQFSVTLPDGSMVWLNNASSLRFPPAFSGASRDVYLTGEAYFEVEKNTKSFIVHSTQNGKEYTVKVLGTNFNISAYPDDPDIRTTLLTGKVFVSIGNKTDILHPGEQLIAGKDGSWDISKDIEARYSNAWKRDSIYFEGDLPQVMRQITRWYNVEIEVQDFKRAGEFECVFPRGPLPLLLEDLCRNHDAFHFAFQGNKILITR
ncbi:MAG TPA: FecR domain-containing protein, partial [Puia sp.]|nr:FecR domain-containing protein [Puia sp.]